MTTPIVRFIEDRCIDEQATAVQRQALRATAGLFPDEDLHAIVRRCAAYRRILTAEFVNMHCLDIELGCGCDPDDIRNGECPYSVPENSAVLRALASIWSTHPYYRHEWAEPKD